MAIKSSARTRLVLIRHGRALDAEDRCIGHTDLALSPDGAVSMHDLCAFASSLVADSARVVSSDLRRALDSAAIVAAALPVPVEVDPRLREMNFGEWDGREWSELERNDGVRLRTWTDRWTSESPPNGESVADLRHRAADWLRDLARSSDERDQTIIVVSHAGWIRMAVTLLLDRPLERLFEIPIDHAHATVIDCRSSRTELVAENVLSTTSLLDASR